VNLTHVAVVRIRIIKCLVKVFMIMKQYYFSTYLYNIFHFLQYSVYVYVYVCVCVFIYIYIYIYREREREREKGGVTEKDSATV
jgi:hypothetical protein